MMCLQLYMGKFYLIMCHYDLVKYFSSTWAGLSEKTGIEEEQKNLQHHFGDSEGHRRKVDGAGTPGTTLAQASILSEVSDPLRDAIHSGGGSIWHQAAFIPSQHLHIPWSQG